MIEDASKEFSPKAPKLADYVRSEQRRLDAINRPKTIGYQPAPHAFKDWRETHRRKTEDLEARGFVCIPNVSIEDWVSGGKRRRWPVGTQWFWGLSEAWSPS